MEHIEELLYQGVAILIFCIGFQIFFTQIGRVDQILHLEKDTSNNFYHRSLNRTNLSVSVSKEEVMAYFLLELECDIEIDGILYRKGVVYSRKMEEYLLKNNYFRKSILHEEGGEVSRLVFNSYEKREVNWEGYFQG